MSLPRPNESYHFKANLIWWDSPFKSRRKCSESAPLPIQIATWLRILVFFVKNTFRFLSGVPFPVEQPQERGGPLGSGAGVSAKPGQDAL
jgi:hypothetical protein